MSDAVIIGDSTAIREACVDVDLSVWARDARACPDCGLAWTVESIKAHGATIASISPRILVCGLCWTKRGAP